MSMTFNFSTDEELQNALTVMDSLPSDTVIGDRIWCAVPVADFESCPSELGDGRQAMDGDSNNYYRGYEDDDVVYTVMAVQSTTLDGEPSGSFSEAFTKETLILWRDYFGVDAFYLSQPVIASENI